MRHGRGSRTPARAILMVLTCLLAACTSEQVIHANAPPATRAEQAPVNQRLLDVGIQVFDPGLPKGDESKESSDA